MQTNDYFTAEDMKHHGPDIWERVRTKLREQGHEIIKGYGEYGRGCKDAHFIYLSQNGNLIHVKELPKGARISIEKFLGLGKFHALKIRTGNDTAIVKEAFNYLVTLGFSDMNRRSVTSGNGKMVGILADSDGVIYSILTDGGWHEKYTYAEEIIFDKKITVTLNNFRPARKRIIVSGFEVYEDDFNKFLEENAIKNAA